VIFMVEYSGGGFNVNSIIMVTKDFHFSFKIFSYLYSYFGFFLIIII